MKKSLVIAVCLFFIFALAGCSANEAAPSAQPDTDEYLYDSGTSAEYDTANQDLGDNTSILNENAQAYGQKIIYSSYMYIETLDYETSYQGIMQRVKDAGGYVSYSNMYGGTKTTDEYQARSAYFEFRIPVENYNDFLSNTESFGNVTRRTDTSEDVTATYIDIEARLIALKAQEERLLALLEEANDLEYILELEKQLTEVRYEIESYTSLLNTYDNLIAYCTVTIELAEVTTYVPVQTKGFGQKFVEAVVNSLRIAWAFLQGVIVVLVYILPYAAIATGIYFAVRPWARKAAAKNKIKREKRIAEEMARRAMMYPVPQFNPNVMPPAPGNNKK